MFQVQGEENLLAPSAAIKCGLVDRAHVSAAGESSGSQPSPGSPSLRESQGALSPGRRGAWLPGALLGPSRLASQGTLATWGHVGRCHDRGSSWHRVRGGGPGRLSAAALCPGPSLPRGRPGPILAVPGRVPGVQGRCTGGMFALLQALADFFSHEDDRREGLGPPYSQHSIHAHCCIFAGQILPECPQPAETSAGWQGPMAGHADKTAAAADLNFRRWPWDRFSRVWPVPARDGFSASFRTNPEASRLLGATERGRRDAV